MEYLTVDQVAERIGRDVQMVRRWIREGRLEAERIGQIMTSRLVEMAERFPLIGEVRGRGAMVAMELVEDRESKSPAKAATSRLLEEACRQGVIVLKAGTYDNVIRLLPPLTIDEGLLSEGLDVLEKALATVEQESAG